MSKFSIADLKAKYGHLTNPKPAKLTTTKAGQQIPATPPKEGSFTENERAILLRGVIDALRARGETRFNVWHKHGLSRIYFADDSWLSYGTDGTATYGPDRTGDAYRLRFELGLKRAAKRAVRV
jgi:hypothetical protein